MSPVKITKYHAAIESELVYAQISGSNAKSKSVSFSMAMSRAIPCVTNPGTGKIVRQMEMVINSFTMLFPNLLMLSNFPT
jgi:hypothetical protein